MDPTVTNIPMGVGEQPQGRTVKEGGVGVSSNTEVWIGHCYIYEINGKHKVCTTA